MRKSRSEKGGTRTREKVTGLAALSFFVYLLDRLTDRIYQALVNGFFGRILTAYSSEQQTFEKGFIKNHFISQKFKRYFRRFRQFLAKAFETSICLNRVKGFSHKLLAVPLKSYGVSLFFFGLYTVLICLIRWLVPGMEEASVDSVFVGIAACIVSLPLIASYDTLAEASGKSVLLGSVLKYAFGFREESFQGTAQAGRAASNLLLCGGMFAGILTVFVPPLFLLGLVLLLIIVALIFTVPEIGVLLSIFLLPFFSFSDAPAFFLGVLVVITAFSYLVKLICGKRILKIELLDLAVVLFGLLIYFSGIISAGGTQGYREALLSCCLLLGYFLTVNLLRTEQWLNRCAKALFFSGSIVAVIGIVQYAFGAVEMQAWLDTSYFYDIHSRAVSLFENPNVLATYLLLVLPFALYCTIHASLSKEKLLFRLATLSILLCLILTWSRGAWIAAIVTLLLFFLIYSKKTTRFLVLLCGIVPVLAFVLPQSIVRRFTSIGDLADSSSLYRVYTWKGTWHAIREYLMGGVGYGNAAYAEIYPQFAYAGMEAAAHSHNLFLQIVFGMGIGGLLVFVAILLLSAQMNFEYLKQAKGHRSRLLVLSCMCAVLSSLIMGLFDYIWYNYRIFFLFWVVLAMACACVRVGNTERQRHSLRPMQEMTDASLELRL